MHNGPYTLIISAVGGLLQGSAIQFEDKVVPGASTVALASKKISRDGHKLVRFKDMVQG